MHHHRHTLGLIVAGASVATACGCASPPSPASIESAVIQTGTPDTVSAMMVFDDGTGPALYLATSAYNGTWSDSHMYRWTGRAWNDLGEFPDQSLSNFFVLGRGSGASLYAAVNTLAPDRSVRTHNIRWDGSRWSPAEIELKGRMGRTYVIDDGSGAGPVQYATGLLELDRREGTFGIARFDGERWSPLPEPADGERVYSVGAMEVFDDGAGGPALFVAGSFSRDGARGRSAIAKWTGQSWEFASGSGFEGGCQAGTKLAVFDRFGAAPALITTGSFTHINGTASGGVAAMRGRVWTDLNGGIDGAHWFKEIYSMTVLDDAEAGAGRAAPALYVAGGFRQIGGVPANFVAQWDGTCWHALGEGFDSYPELIVFDDGGGPALYAGGTFQSSGGVMLNHIAKWDGHAWQTLRGPMRLVARP